MEDAVDFRWRLLSPSSGTPTALCTFYAPDTGRGLPARADFWTRLQASLVAVRERVPLADLVLAGDGNTWLPELMPGHAPSRDAAVVQAFLQANRLTLAPTANMPTHRRGTVLDWIATSANVAVHNVAVHNLRHCSCPRRIPCAPLLGSDHFALTFSISKPWSQPRPTAPRWPNRVDWAAAVHRAMPDIGAWHDDVLRCLALPAPASQGARRATLDILSAALVTTLWTAAEARLPRPGPPKPPQPDWWSDECLDALLRRNAAFRTRRRSPSADAELAFRSARNQFHRVVRRAKHLFWRRWLSDIDTTRSRNPREAARRVRRRFSHLPCAAPADISGEETDLASSAPLAAWRNHFSNVSQNDLPHYDRRHYHRIRRRVARLRREAASHVGSFDSPFTEPELLAALRELRHCSAPGTDGLPYEVWTVRDSRWHHALLSFLELVRTWATVPTVWREGIVVPIHKSGSTRDPSNYRPITLLTSLTKLFERLVLRRIGPALNPILDPAQAGFRWGADVQAYALAETLRFRGSQRTWAAFVDVRKAYDIAWRDAALARLHRAGVQGRIWLLLDDLCASPSSQVRIDGCFSASWENAEGVRQGSVLSPLLFNVLFNGVAAAVRRACPGVRLGPDLDAPRVSLLLYADDIVILAECQEELQAALDALALWASRWRFSFAVGPSKSAAVCFNPPRQPPRPLRLAGSDLPFVPSYTYLGVVFHCRGSTRPHAQHAIARGERKFRQCCAWAHRQGLHAAWLDDLFRSYVLPSAAYGLELATPAGERAFDRALTRWGRRILGWPDGAPRVAVFGDLGWHRADALALRRRASLFVRLLRGPPPSCRFTAHDVFRYAFERGDTWAADTARAIALLGVPSPASWGIGEGVPSSSGDRWLRAAFLPRLEAHARETHHTACAAINSLGLYHDAQPAPRLQTLVHNTRIHATSARAWGLARCGHHPFADGRSARHVGSTPTPCQCGAPAPTLRHALTACPATADLRARWAAAVQLPVEGLPSWDALCHFLFHPRHQANTASSVRQHVAFVGAVDRRRRTFMERGST